jgi:glycosyltransferase involved in cell wall biosynthesis
MRLLFVLPEFPPHSGGGIGTFYRILLPELAKQGHSIRVLVGSAFTSSAAGYEQDGVAVEFLDDRAVTANLSRFDSFRAIPNLRRHLAAAWTAWEHAAQQRECDLVETVDWGLLFVPWVVDLTGPPTVVQLHGSLGQLDYHDPKFGDELFGSIVRLLEPQILAAADELQTYSLSNAREWEQMTGRDVTYIPSAWAPDRAAAVARVSSGAGVTVGRIQSWKGPATLCEALRLLGRRAPNVDWIGRDTTSRSGGSMSDHLSQQFPDVWGTKVRPIGPVSTEEAARRQASAAFALVPSDWDVFNFTCAEAMGTGQVLLCSSGAGASELIVDGENAFTFPARNAAALAAKLEEVSRLSVHRHDQISAAARDTIRTALDPVRVARTRAERYELLVKRGRTRRAPHAWTGDAVRPGEPLDRTLAFLDNLPLRELSGYAVRRGLTRVFQ